MKKYVTPELHYFVLNAQDVLTESNDLEFDVKDWIEGGLGK